jgi:hypothetical protein
MQSLVVSRALEDGELFHHASVADLLNLSLKEILQWLLLRA